MDAILYLELLQSRRGLPRFFATMLALSFGLTYLLGPFGWIAAIVGVLQGEAAGQRLHRTVRQV